MAASYIPEAGDIVWLHFDPQAGHEQAGQRSALVVSPAAYNAKTGLMLYCPITTKIKGYPFEVIIDANLAGAVLADQIKSLDWVARMASYKAKITATQLEEVRKKATLLIAGQHKQKP
ncbi:MAG: endoribonuclease MazF [Bdellovibrio sp.]|nr:endoribonuclease MazF [Methylotenera sp.]